MSFMSQSRNTPSTQAAGAGRPRTKPAAVRRDELMDAAEALFIAQGVEPTTIDDVVARANVAKGTFYHYFPSKLDMLAALRERFSQRYWARVNAALDACQSRDWRIRLHHWTRGCVEAYLAMAAMHDAIYHDTHYQHGNHDRDVALDHIQRMLEAGAQAGAWPLDTPRLNAILLFHGIHGVVDDALAHGHADAKTLARDLTDRFLRMLGAA